MRDIHEPRPDFVQRLEWQVGAEIRRRNRQATAPQPGPSRRRLIFGALALALVSMAAGGAVVAAAYQSQANQERQALAATYQRRLELAQERLDLARTQQRDIETRVEIGTAAREAAFEARLGVIEAETQVQAAELQLAEVRITGREPRMDISAPLVQGRDFVVERWKAELNVPDALLALHRLRAEAAKRRFDVGLADALEVEAVRMKVEEVELATEAAVRRVAIRNDFVKGRISAAMAELRAAEVETTQRRRSLELQLELAQRQANLLRARVATGGADQLDVSRAALRVRELELEIMKADHDLQVIRRQLAGKDQ